MGMNEDLQKIGRIAEAQLLSNYLFQYHQPQMALDIAYLKQAKDRYGGGASWIKIWSKALDTAFADLKSEKSRSGDDDSAIRLDSARRRVAGYFLGAAELVRSHLVSSTVLQGIVGFSDGEAFFDIVWPLCKQRSAGDEASRLDEKRMELLIKARERAFSKPSLGIA